MSVQHCQSECVRYKQRIASPLQVPPKHATMQCVRFACARRRSVR